MAQATETAPDLTYEDIRDEYSKFHARVSPTDIKGVHNLKLIINRPFRDSQELADWLYARVARLERDIDAKGI